jgi:hypothetical protein
VNQLTGKQYKPRYRKEQPRIPQRLHEPAFLGNILHGALRAPNGLVDRMTDQEVRDLLAYLQSRR